VIVKAHQTFDVVIFNAGIMFVPFEIDDHGTGFGAQTSNLLVKQKRDSQNFLIEKTKQSCLDDYARVGPLKQKKLSELTFYRRFYCSIISDRE
jgi:hypothetical protein